MTVYYFNGKKSFMSHNTNIALEQLNRSLPYVEATEATSFIIKTLDFLIRHTNNFKTTMFNIHKSFKRSELKTYCESHVFAYNKFLTSGYFDPSLLVPIPYGMKTSYHSAMITIDGLYRKLDINTTIKILYNYFHEVEKTGQILQAEEITRSIHKLDKEQTEIELRKVFTNDRTLEVKLGSVFTSHDMVITVGKHILGYNTIFKQLENIYSDLSSIEKIIDKIITELENKRDLRDMISIHSLYQLVKTASIQIDLFGVILGEMQRLEHNYVVVLRRLVEATP